MTIRRLILLILHFLASLIIFRAGAGTVRYGLLIKQVSQQYGARGIIIGTSVHYEALGGMKTMYNVSREIFTEGMLSTIVDLTKLSGRLKFYCRHTVRPLVVIFVNEMNEVKKFRNNTAHMDMSCPVWLLLFTGDDEDSCRFCRDPAKDSFNLKFNSMMLVSCCNSGYIEEWRYGIENDIRKWPRGKLLDEIGGIQWYSDATFYNDHFSEDKRNFRVFIVTGSPYAWKIGNKLEGFMGEIFTELSRVMNIAPSSLLEAETPGLWNFETSVWTGAVGTLVRDEADMVVSEFLMNEETLNYIDYTLPVVTVKYTLYIKQPDDVSLEWDAYLKAFSPKIWMAILICLLMTTIVLTLIRYRRKFNLFNMLCEHCLKVWGIFCQQGLSEFPDETPSRIVCISIFMSAIVAYAAYAGSLTSYLSTPSLFLPFHTMEEFVNDGTYKLIVLRGGAEYDMLATSTDALLKKMMALLKPMDSLPDAEKDIFKVVCSEKVAVFASEALKLRMKKHIPCRIAEIKTGMMCYFSMGLPLNSQYTGLVNYHLQKFQQNGVMGRLKHKYFRKKIPAAVLYSSATFWGILPILAIFGAGVTIALIIFIIERIRGHRGGPAPIPLARFPQLL